MNILDEIKLAFRDNWRLLLFSSIIFIVSLVIGFIYQASLHSTFAPVVQQLTNDLEQGIITFTFKDIFINNIIIVFEVFILGIVFCFSIFILLFNGFFLGYFIASQPDLFQTLMLIIPHGIFELPSLVIATSSGLVLFKFIYKVIKCYSEFNGSFKVKISSSIEVNFKYFKESVILLCIAAILMIIAGFIEVYITLNIANWIFSIFGV